MALTKQVIIVRKDLRMSKGKMAAQVAHASLGALFKGLGIGKFATPIDGTTYRIYIPQNSALDHWLNQSFTKVVLEVADEAELMDIYNRAKASNMVPCSLIEDEGRTEFDVATVTCLAIGPAFSEAIDHFTGHLKLYKDEQADFYLQRRIQELEKENDEKNFLIDELKKL